MRCSRGQYESKLAADVKSNFKSILTHVCRKSYLKLWIVSIRSDELNKSLCFKETFLNYIAKHGAIRGKQRADTLGSTWLGAFSSCAIALIVILNFLTPFVFSTLPFLFDYIYMHTLCLFVEFHLTIASEIQSVSPLGRLIKSSKIAGRWTIGDFSILRRSAKCTPVLLL